MGELGGWRGRDEQRRAPLLGVERRRGRGREGGAHFVKAGKPIGFPYAVLRRGGGGEGVG